MNVMQRIFSLSTDFANLELLGTGRVSLTDVMLAVLEFTQKIGGCAICRVGTSR